MIPSLLLVLLDGRSPAGAHSHSGGMEPAVADGLVTDLADVRAFCRGRLLTAGRVAAGAAAAACRLTTRSDRGADSDWLALDGEVSARTASPAARGASRALGSGLLRLLRASVPTADLLAAWRLLPRPAPHHPLVLGAGCAMAGADASTAARAAALATCTGPASAAGRLLSLDPYAVAAVLAGLGPQIDAVADEAAATPDIPAECAPGLDLLADVHLLQEVRLFAS